MLVTNTSLYANHGKLSLNKYSLNSFNKKSGNKPNTSTETNNQTNANSKFSHNAYYQEANGYNVTFKEQLSFKTKNALIQYSSLSNFELREKTQATFGFNAIA